MTTESDALARICADTSLETARRKAATPLEAIREQARNAKPTRGFARALVHTATDRFALIAEIKKASPSGGLIRPDFDPAALARAYAAAGATCLSVLTDAPYFQGHADYLRAARAAVELPVLRKDFILDPWQVYETRAMGADCILLIIAALTDDEARELEQLAHALGLDVLVEVHNREELDRALSLQSRLIGINNRNLKTLKTDINTTVELAGLVPPDRFLIGESGLRTHADLQLLAQAGVRSFLIGESLMRQDDVEAATRTLLFG
ncbi:MAG: indole-3-glycerol phosphate synthase TrpC [Acetobacteraceae bacterium]|nr:indole-3-glycerol phosphate synthase TrpC [Acetobacteraceae bacterium]